MIFLTVNVPLWLNVVNKNYISFKVSHKMGDLLDRGATDYIKRTAPLCVCFAFVAVSDTSVTHSFIPLNF